MSRLTQWPNHRPEEVQERRRRLNAFLNSAEAQALRDRLRPDLAKYLDPSLDFKSARPNTQRAYETDQCRYIAVAEESGVDPLMPGPDWWALYFIDYASEELATGFRRRYSTVERHAVGIANLFTQHGFSSPTRTFVHKWLMKDLLQRFPDERQTKKARPLMGKPLYELLRSPDKSTLRGLRDHTICASGGTHGPRAAALVSMRIEQVLISERGVQIGLRDQKTSRSRELEYTLQPHREEDVVCLPCSMREFIEQQGCSEGPLFRAIDRWGNISERPMSTRSITDILQKNLRRIGNSEASTYSSHSFRHGVVTTAALKGWPIEEIMLLTGHRSKRSLLEYVQGINPWYGAPVRSVLAEPLEERGPESGWIH
jgi:site-specific recombinase XerD